MVHSRYRWAGGEEATVERQVRMLRSRGHVVATYEVRNPVSSGSSMAALLVAPWNPKQFLRVKALIGEFSPDLVHVHNLWFSITPSAISACRALSVPVVATIQNYRTVCPEAHLFRNLKPCTDCLGKFPLPGIRHSCYRDSAALTGINGIATQVNSWTGNWEAIDRVHVPSDFARAVLERGPLNSSQLVSFPNAVPDPGPRPMEPSQSKEVLFVGRLAPEKGLDLILEAWRRRSPQGLQLTVLGDGPERIELEADAPEGVRFLGTVSVAEVTRRLLSARALLFPSKWFEVCPMVIVEGLSAGVPILGHDLGAISELLDHSAPESLVSPTRRSGWDEALDLIDDGQTMDRLGLESREAFLARHTFDAWYGSHMDLYSAAIANHSM